MFIVGADLWSRHWLAANRPRLQQLGAVGVAANVESIEALQSLQRLAAGLPLTAASLDSLAGTLGVSIYPVLIHPDGLVTQGVR